MYNFLDGPKCEISGTSFVWAERTFFLTWPVIEIVIAHFGSGMSEITENVWRMLSRKASMVSIILMVG